MPVSLNYNGQRFDNFTAEQLVGLGVPQATIDAAIGDRIVVEAHRQIDAICDSVYTTSPSRDARYANKYDEAVRYKEAGYPASVSEAEYPTLVNEAPKRNMTKRQLADLVIARRDAFNVLGGKAEAARAEIETAVASAGDHAAKLAAAAAIVSAFAQLAG